MSQAAIKSYRDLLIWQRGMDVVEASYRICKQLPDEERYGLISQLRRAAVSIPANIAEGHGRELPGSFVQHLRIAQGSLKEVETLLMLIQRLDLVGQASVVPILDSCDELGRMLRAMIRTVQEKQ